MAQENPGSGGAPVAQLRVAAYRIPTDRPESDGTLQWDSTTMVAVHVEGGGRCGFGYSYSSAGAASIVKEQLAQAVIGLDAFDVPRCWRAMRTAIRNLGQGGIAAMAVAAVDTALWDLKARLLDLPLARLLGRARDAVPIYGSGGFTSYSDAELRKQLGGWADAGIEQVKMKIGREPERDPERIRAARDAIGPDTALFVDANGAFSPRQALAMAQVLAEHGVTWYEEPVPQQDVEGLRFVRERVPPGIDLTAGEYAFHADDLRMLLQAAAVDVLMADITRCGLTGLLQAGALCDAYRVPLSAHCAPALHLHPCCALPALRHIEYFHDHVRIETRLLEGTAQPDAGALKPDLGRPGHGLSLRARDAEPYAL